MSFPVAGTLMVEPTESESHGRARPLHRRDDRDPRRDPRRSRTGALDRADNPLKHAPHTAAAVAADDWTHALSRASRRRIRCASLRGAKYWPPVARVDNVYGDRNLFCSCIPVADSPRRRCRRATSAAPVDAAEPDCASSCSAPAWSASPPRGISPQDGHEVTVVDRQPGAALETSFANGGQISASYAEPWANPGGAAARSCKWLGQRRRAAPVPAARRSGGNGAGACSSSIECLPSRTRHNTIQCLNLALYSRDCLKALRAADRHRSTTSSSAASCSSTPTPKEFDARRRGGRADARVRLRPRREDRRRMRRDRAGARAVPRRVSPAASSRRPTSRAMRSASPQELARMARGARRARSAGACTIESLVAEGDAMRGVRCIDERARRKEVLDADAYVRGARQLQPVPAAAARRAVPRLSGEGLLGDDRDRRASRRADGVADRPRVEDRVHAPRRPAARRRHRGACRATTRT